MRGFAASFLLGFWVRILRGSCECCVLSGVCTSGWSLVQRSLTECGVCECDREPRKGRPRPGIGSKGHGGGYYIFYFNSNNTSPYRTTFCRSSASSRATVRPASAKINVVVIPMRGPEVIMQIQFKNFHIKYASQKPLQNKFSPPPPPPER